MIRVLLISLFVINTALANVEFSKDFFFGIANAPAHVEDQLDDIWTDFAKAGGVYAFYNQYKPERRLNFWTQPEIELDLAKKLGVQVFRIGVDWGRVEPERGRYDFKVLKRYKQIIQMIKARGMKVMLTLFHHTEPRWSLSSKSWLNKKNKDSFIKFSNLVLDYLHEDIDYLCTFNEANVYLMLGLIDGLWPSYYKKGNYLRFLNAGPIQGKYNRSLRNMARAHKAIFNHAKKYNLMVGMAHNFSDQKGQGLLGKPISALFWKKINYKFVDLIKDHVDYIGINYYGAEYFNLGGPILYKDRVYSDSGRSISPEGFREVLKRVQKRYGDKPIIITENGVADSQDIYRPSYLMSHLKVLRDRIAAGQKILGYIFWTLSDNWEWADGYCPKFGLVAVDRKDNFKRIPRDSFYVYQKIIKDAGFSQQMEDKYWQQVVNHFGKPRDFCRAQDAKTPLDAPVSIPLKPLDFRKH